jgi:hypothetical protein
MTESPPIDVNAEDVRNGKKEEADKLRYVHALFSGTLRAYPAAALRLTGPIRDVWAVNNALVNTFRMRSDQFVHSPVAQRDARTATNVVKVTILYWPPAADKPGANGSPAGEKVEVVFEWEGSSAKVEFEMSPDGKRVEEVKGKLAQFKAQLKGLTGRVQAVKIVTKVVGVAEFDPHRSDKIEAIKGKVMAGLSANVKPLPWMKNFITVELSGDLGGKYEPAKGEGKPVFGGFLQFTVPLDLP